MRRVLRALIAALAGRPILLSAELLEWYPELRGATWRRGGLPPRLGGWALGQSSVAGITVGRTVFLAPHASLEPGFLLHELAHVHQFARDGAFPVRYLWESIRRGYHRNRFELEADRYAASRLSRPSSGV